MDAIQILLGDRYRMFYHSAWPLSRLTTIQTLDKVIDITNTHIHSHGRDIHGWPVHARVEIARLVRVNWIYQRLNSEPIRKPILVHEESGRLVVDCGDTRIMAQRLYNAETTLPVMITLEEDCAERYRSWNDIRSDIDLISLLGFDPENCQIFYTPTDPGSSHAVTWFEIGDPSTAHHLHDIDQRRTMAQHYLNQQKDDFEFSMDWCVNNIDWTQYQ